MSFGHDNDLGSNGNDARTWRALLIAGAVCCLGVVALGVPPASAVQSGAIPAWLDDGISEWNKANPSSTIRFVDIKDSYVWYTMAGSDALSSKDIRGRVYNIAYKNGYTNSQDEEIVTTGKPPVATGPVTTKKCWTRSFMRDVQKGSPTTVERMLTTMVCEDGENWAAGFRVLQ